MFHKTRFKNIIGSLLATSVVLIGTSCNRSTSTTVYVEDATAQISTLSTSSAQAENEYLIKRNGLAYIDESFQKTYNIEIVKEISTLGIELIKLNDPSTLDKLKSDTRLAFVEPNYIRKLNVVIPQNPNTSSRSYSKKIGLSQASSITQGKSFLTVAIVGTGVDLNHPDLKDKLVTGFSVYGNTVNDIQGSGTHQAGVIVASNSTYGIEGVAPNCKIMPIKVMSDTGEATDADLIEGTAWAVAHGANVVTLTVEGSNSSKAIDSLVEYAFNKNVPIVVGSGDNSLGSETYPAATKGVISVSATDSSDALASFSNHGKWISVSAPGKEISSTTPIKTFSLSKKGVPANYAILSGTWISAAYVAGSIALIKSKYPTLDMVSLRKHLENTTDDLGTKGYDEDFGYGRLNLAKSLLTIPTSLQKKVK